MCRQPEKCGRHMECACYFADKVSAIGLTPPRSEVSSLTARGINTAALGDQELVPSSRANPPEGRSAPQEPPFKKTSSVKLRPIPHDSSTPDGKEP